MKKSKNTKERGLFKDEIHSALYKNNDIVELVLGDNLKDCKSASDKRNLFKKHVKSHLFIDDTIEDTDTYIFYDVLMPHLGENLKECKVVLYAICHRDILDNYTKEGYPGNRADILSQMIEDCLVNDYDVANSFGIGGLSLDSVGIYNSKRFYGCIMNFSVPNFR